MFALLAAGEVCLEKPKPEKKSVKKVVRSFRPELVEASETAFFKRKISLEAARIVNEHNLEAIKMEWILPDRTFQQTWINKEIASIRKDEK